jgi:hypothetical protein
MIVALNPELLINAHYSIAHCFVAPDFHNLNFHNFNYNWRIL